GRNRYARAHRSPVLRVRDPDSAIHVCQFDLRTTIADLAVEIVTDVLAVFDLDAEVVANHAVDSARTNHSVRIRRNDERDVPVDRAERDWFRLVELCEGRLQCTVDSREFCLAHQTARGNRTVD